MHSRSVIIISTICVAIASLVIFFVAVVNGWFGAAHWGSGAGEFCEAFRPGIIKQPANTWSNLSFVFAGLYMAWQLTRNQFQKNNNGISRGLFYGTFLSCLTVLLGPGSMAMHATGSDIGGFFDMLSMYLIISFLASYAAKRFFGFGAFAFTAMFTAILAICIWADGQPYHIVFPFFGVTVFAFFVGVTIVFETLNIYIRQFNHNSKWAYASLASFGLAFFIWNLSLTDAVLCNPSSLIQGHAAWHTLDAASVYCLFRFYVSEHHA